jgi:hypothetical protein
MLPHSKVVVPPWRIVNRYTVHACAYGLFGALDRGRGRLARRFLHRCAAGCDGRRLEHDRAAGLDILDDLYFDDDFKDAFRDDNDTRVSDDVDRTPNHHRLGCAPAGGGPPLRTTGRRALR